MCWSNRFKTVLFLQVLLLVFLLPEEAHAGAFLSSHCGGYRRGTTTHDSKPLQQQQQQQQQQQPNSLLPIYHNPVSPTPSHKQTMITTIRFLSQMEPSEIYCRSVSPTAAAAASSSDGMRVRRVLTRRKMTTSMDSSSSSSGNRVGWQGKLLKASNFASMLCVVDCTVLPLVTVGFPLVGLVANPATMGSLHALGHWLALFFVLPVGGSATVLNYLYAHRKSWIAALGVLGLLLVFISNAPHSFVEAISIPRVHNLLHAVHCGMTHHLANIAGCACLLSANFFSQRTGKCLHGPNCSHDHSSSPATTTTTALRKEE